MQFDTLRSFRGSLVGLLLALMCAGSLTAQDNRSNRKPLLYLEHSQTAQQNHILIRADKPIDVYHDFLLQSPPRLVIDVENARLEQNIQIEVNQGALLRIRAANNSNKARIVFDLIESSETRYRIDPKGPGLLATLWLSEKVTPAIDKPAPPSPIKAERYQDSRKTISVELVDADISDFFAVVAKQNGIVIKLAPGIAAPVTLRLIDMPLEQALQLVSEIYHLEILQEQEHWFVQQAH